MVRKTIIVTLICDKCGKQGEWWSGYCPYCSFSKGNNSKCLEREVTAEITYILKKFEGLKEGYVVLGIKILKSVEEKVRELKAENDTLAFDLKHEKEKNCLPLFIKRKPLSPFDYTTDIRVGDIIVTRTRERYLICGEKYKYFLLDLNTKNLYRQYDDVTYFNSIDKIKNAFNIIGVFKGE